MHRSVSRLARLLCLALMATLLPAAPSQARAVAPAGTQQQELSAPVQGDYFGSSVAVSADGSTALVGASDNAYVFARSGAGWTQQQELTPADAARKNGFGSSVALAADGTTALVGADDVDGSTGGAAYVFVRRDAGWTQQQELRPADAARNNGFGGAVALSADGSSALVGASSKDSNTGASYVFVRVGTTWTQQQELTAAGGAEGDAFGSAVALSADGTTALVGAYLKNQSGAADVFVRSGSTWTQQQDLSVPLQYVGSGSAVALSADGSTALVGADYGNGGTGAAYVFGRSGTTWTQRQELTAAHGAEGDSFGSSVALSADGTTALVGAVNGNGGTGAAYVFGRSGTIWTPWQELTAADGANGDSFGSSAALSADGTTALVGAFTKNVENGAVYVASGITTPSAQSGPPAVHTTSPACLGPHDLIVDDTQIALGGEHTFDQVCIVDGATLLALNLTLRAGVVYLDATSHIDADGLPGGPNSADVGADCSPTGNEKPGGGDGSPLTILAHQAIVLGAISSNGGAANMDLCATNYLNGENGGRGGQVTLEAAALSFSGTIAARGGDGGQQPGTDGNGGHGGTINVLLPAAAGRPQGSFDISGGQPGTSSFSAWKPGRPGEAGTISVAALTPAQLAALPPAPAAPLQILGQAPARLPLQPAAVFATSMRCGAGDLDVGRGATVRLAGVQRFAHVCIHDGGVLTGGGWLTLIASTIAVDARSRISANGVNDTAIGSSGKPGVPPVPARTVPGAGTPGAAGTAAGVCCGGTLHPPAGGAGGGAIALVARTVLLAGGLSADGAPGGKGYDGFGSPSNCGRGGQGAGGGAGGGIYIRAATLQLSGQIGVAGGKGGAGGQDECLTDGTAVADGGDHGAPGLVLLLVDTLRAAPGPLPIAGPAALGQTLPVDPAPPTDVEGAQYVAAIGSGAHASLLGHSLAGPFLAYYRRYGGLPTFGYPRTESFAEGGHQVQYTERFLLQLVGGSVVTAPLGRQLTAGRAYARVVPFASTPTRRYFAATGHSLSGQFLAFWSTHHGATLLGAPISEVVSEQNGDGSGRTYPLQWFEQGRLEYHAARAGTPYAVQIGLLGTQALRQRGWLP